MKRLNKSKEIENFAFRKLAGQEWSYFLLKRKILERTDKPELIEPVLDKLVKDGWLDDVRFAECYIRSTRDNKGYGPIKIRHKLKEKGISSAIIDKHLFEDHPIWERNAFNIRLKKYGSKKIDIKERSKQSTFLQSRGFTFSQIKVAFQDNLADWYQEIVPPEEDKDNVSLIQIIDKIK